jgi:ribonuclease P protein component
MVLHYLSERPEHSVRGASAAVAPEPPQITARAGFVVGRAVGNSVVRHRVTRRLRELVRAELHRLPATADLVVRARPEAGSADSAVLRRDLAAGLDRLLPHSAGTP